MHTYDYDRSVGRIGLQAAEALGVEPGCMLKTLMVLVDGKPACAIIAADLELSIKKVAAAFSGKHAEMMPVAAAERLCGYKVGGISPFGQMRCVPRAVDERAFVHAEVFVHGGQRGLQIRINPEDARRDARCEPLRSGAGVADLAGSPLDSVGC